MKNPQYDFPKMRGGGAKAVWNFSENSSVLEWGCFPKGTQEKLIELESESDIFMQNRKIYHGRLPITTFA